MPTPNIPVIKISQTGKERSLEGNYLLVTPIFAPALKTFIENVSPLEIKFQFKNLISNDAANAAANQIKGPALLSIKKISQRGLVTLQFSKEVIVLKNHTELFDKNYFDRELHNNLELLIMKDIDN